MNYAEKWKIIELLGSGGQGKVYRVSKKAAEWEAGNNIIDALKYLSSPLITADARNEQFERFKKGLLGLIKLDNFSEQGALKVLHEPEAARDANLAAERIKKEIQAMSENIHPNLLKILDVGDDSKWYVSEFHPKGSLSKNIEMFKADSLKALKAFRPLVEAVAKLHEKNYVHRDIKPQNVFIDSNDNLILGDFGLIYFVDEQHTRISATLENVGSRDWMPAWAMGMRIDDIKPSFDVFSLGKLLWSMVSGLHILRLWYFERPEFNLEKLFPDSAKMNLVNDLFKKCIVENEEDCLSDANSLLYEVDNLISVIENKAEKISLKVERTCKVCGIGKYKLIVNDNVTDTRNFGLQPTGSRQMKIFTCSYCGNVQFFSYERQLPEAWQE